MSMASVSASYIQTLSVTNAIHKCEWSATASCRRPPPAPQCSTCGGPSRKTVHQSRSDWANVLRFQHSGREPFCRVQQHNSRTGKRRQRLGKAIAGIKDAELTDQPWGPPVRLGTAQIPQDVNLDKLRTLLYQKMPPASVLDVVAIVAEAAKFCLEMLIILFLFPNVQWGSSITQNANMPLVVPLKVDRIEEGVRLGYIKVVNGQVEDLVHIDVIVTPASEGQPKAMFRALRNGPLKDSVPPGEAMLMQSLLIALKKSIPLARM